ncbi:MAG: glycosyltransferase [Verrucomicrobiota bacterium JB022]|nr:glycosyltransferase [Verrucomicrobiota bacterium JB022]
MRVLLTSHGSTGDIYPMIRLGRALIDAGHECRFATTPFFREEVERAGISFVRLPPDWNQAGFAEAMRELTHAKNGLETLQKIYDEALPYADEIFQILLDNLPWADVFCLSYVFGPMGQLARMCDVPVATANFAHHVIPSSQYPPEPLPRLLLWPKIVRRPWNKLLWKIVDKFIVWRIHQAIHPAYDRNDVPLPQSFLLEPADVALVMVSKALFQPKTLWSDRFVFTGYLRWQSEPNPEIEAAVNAFCEGEKVPVLTFGSVTFEQARHVMHRFMTNWPRGKKIIVQAGWANLTFETPRPDVKFIGKVSHDQLFRHASCVIHHGGAGTTGTVLHAGVPHIIIPHIGDQWFFADEMERLGVGMELKRKKWPENLARSVRKVEASKRMNARAKKMAEILANEDGPAAAVEALEKLAREGRKPEVMDVDTGVEPETEIPLDVQPREGQASPR